MNWFVPLSSNTLFRIKVLRGLKVRTGSDIYFFGESRDVVKVKPHPDFNFDTGAYDCAVLKVGRSFSHHFPFQVSQFHYAIFLVWMRMNICGGKKPVDRQRRWWVDKICSGFCSLKVEKDMMSRDTAFEINAYISTEFLILLFR